MKASLELDGHSGDLNDLKPVEEADGEVIV